MQRNVTYYAASVRALKALATSNDTDFFADGVTYRTRSELYTTLHRSVPGFRFSVAISIIHRLIYFNMAFLS